MNSFLHLLAKDLIQKYGYHFDNLILIRLQSSSQSGNLIRQELQIKLRKA